MALLLLDGCEDFSTFSQSGAVISSGRYQNGIRLTSSSTQFVYRPLAAQEADTITVGFAFRWAGPASTCNLMNLMSDAAATSHNTLRIEASGALAVTRGSTAIITTAASLIVPNTWNYVELQIKLADASAVANLRLNGASVGTFTGDTKNAGTKTVYDAIQWIVSSGHTVDFDDVYVCMATTTADAFIGNLAVETLYPVSDTGGVGAFVPTGSEEYITIGNAPDGDQSSREVGNTVTFSTVGQVTKVRHYRRPATPTTVTINVWSYPAGALLAGPISDTSSATGYREVTLPTPLLVAAGQTLLISIGYTTNTPEHAFATDPITNSANCTLGGPFYANTLGTFPTNAHFSVIFILPVFVPGTMGSPTNGWNGSDGDKVDNYALIDDRHPINDNDYVYSATTGVQDMYNLSDLVHTSGTIVGVCHSARMIRTDTATTMNVKLINHRAADTKSASLALTTAYRNYEYVLTTDPETGAAFTIANVNALQSGIELA